MGLISAIMAIGVNLQWGFAGFVQCGRHGALSPWADLAVVLVSTPPTPGAWSTGGYGVVLALLLGAATVVAAVMVAQKMPKGRTRTVSLVGILLIGFFVYRAIFDPNVSAIEAINPAIAGNIGGLNLPVLLAWPAGGLTGRWRCMADRQNSSGPALGLSGDCNAGHRRDHHCDHEKRGLAGTWGQERLWHSAPCACCRVRGRAAATTRPSLARAEWLGLDPVTASTLSVKLGYSVLFLVVLLILLWMAQMALKSPWGRMMRAIRDNEVAAEAMGKDVTRRHLQIFVLGSAICGIAGAMMTTLDGQLTPGTYNPLRFTFLVWVMVIVGGSGNNFGAVLGAFLIWFLWVQVEPIGLWLMNLITVGMPDGSALKAHLIDSAAHMRLFTMGLILLIVLRFSPRGLIPEK